MHLPPRADHRWAPAAQDLHHLSYRSISWTKQKALLKPKLTDNMTYLTFKARVTLNQIRKLISSPVIQFSCFQIKRFSFFNFKFSFYCI